MPKVWFSFKSNGFSSVEVLLAATLFGMLAVGLVGAIIYGTSSLTNAGARTRAVALAEEGVEALRSMRDSSFSSLTDGTFGLSGSGATWSLSGSSDVTDIYERQITIAPSGPNRKSITSTVQWTMGGVSRSVSVDTEITNWRSSFRSWVNAILSGTYDASGNDNGVSVAVRGNYAYVARNGGAPNFLVVDITNPASPMLAGSLTLAGSPEDIVLNDSFAYVANGSNTAELQVVDVTNPAAPALRGSYNAPGSADGLSVAYASGLVWLGRNASGSAEELIVVDVSSVDSPVEIYAYESGTAIADMAIENNIIFAATEDNSQELMILDFTNVTSPVVASVTDLPGNTNAQAVHLFNNNLLIGQGSTLWAFDIDDISSPQQLGSYVSSGSVNDITTEVTNEYALLATGASGSELDIVSLQDLSLMSSVRTVDIPGNTSLLGIAYSDEYDIAVGASAANAGEVVVFEPQ